jgi:hypothetical protein
MNPIPEAPETIEAQLEWLVEGKRLAVLLPPGTAVPAIPDWADVMPCLQGVLLFDGRRHRRRDIAAALERGLHHVLGYDVPAPAPGEPHQVVTVRGPNGHEKQAIATSSKRLDDAVAAAERMAGPDDAVTVENGQRVVADRLRSLDGRELRVRPVKSAQDVARLQEAARADNHEPLLVTHLIERGDEVVGYFGVNSLPLYRLWFHSRKLKASDSLRLLFMIENHYRMEGAGVVATIINQQSPFYPVAARGGYLEVAGDRLFLKGL